MTISLEMCMERFILRIRGWSLNETLLALGGEWGQVANLDLGSIVRDASL